MKTKLHSVKLIVVDEISMVSSLTLTYMHFRLEERFGGDEWFGCRNMMFVGDLLQLQPVNGIRYFKTSHKKHFCTNWGALRPLTFGETRLLTTSSPLTSARRVTQNAP